MKYIIIVVIALVLLAGLSAVLHKPTGKKITKISMITVHTFNGGDDMYSCYEYKIDSATRCLTFEDVYGIGHTVCSNYTISTLGK